MTFLTELEQIIRQRIQSGSSGSYVASLSAAGTRRVAQKVGEEAVEFALAAAAGSRSEQVDEAADLLFHFQILLANLDISLAEVAEQLRNRHENRQQPSAI
jgi:phosphoribosyl-ATP pyrophosphohydrolase/phosphoribosyl-AMP cyclohydrolase